MALGEDSPAVPTPLIAAHSALHPVSFQAAVASVGPVHLGAALGADLELLTPVALLQVFITCDARVHSVMAHKADALVAHWANELFLSEVSGNYSTRALNVRALTLEWILARQASLLIG